MRTLTSGVWRSIFRVLLPVIAILLIVAVPAAGVYYAYKISGPMQTPGSSLGEAYYISPDGKYVVFVADREVNGAENVYSVPVAGGPAVRISAEAAVGVHVSQLAISPDSSQVVYRADANTDGVDELFSVPIAGGTVSRLNGTLAAGGEVKKFKISPDIADDYVIYYADQDADERYNLYHVPLAGGEATKVNQNLSVFDDAQDDFAIHPLGLGVVYRVSVHTVSGPKINLYVKNLVNGDVRELNTPLPVGGNVESFKIAPNGLSVIYKADGAVDEEWNLYTSALTAVAVVPITESTLARPIRQYDFAGNGVFIYYLAEHTTAGKLELYAARIDGAGSPVRINPEICAACVIDRFQMAPNLIDAVYRVVDQDRHTSWLYSITSSLGVRKITPDLADECFVGNFEITANNLGLIYLAKANGSQYELFSVAITGGPSLKLNRPLAPETNVRRASVAPNSTGVLYIAQEAGTSAEQLFLTPITVQQVTRLNRDITAAGGNVRSYLLSPDGAWLVYQADGEVLDQRELYLVKNVQPIYLPMVERN